MKILILLVCAFYIASAQVVQLNKNTYINRENNLYTTFKEELSVHFNDKFSCFYDASGTYSDFYTTFYGTGGCQDSGETNAPCAAHYCCGYMANGLKQCDRFEEWSIVEGTHFALCESDYTSAVSEWSGSQPKLRRDLCCANNQFTDCTLCKSFMVWDFTVDDTHGGDAALEAALDTTGGQGTTGGDGNPEWTEPTVFLEDNWRDLYTSRSNQNPTFTTTSGSTQNYPPYAYYNDIYPAGYARGKLREFNDPPVCVYAPNTAGRIIEIKVEPDETGNNICVDDLHEDSLERNTPGVTQACDKQRLRTCFPDAATSDVPDGFAFLISCSESCADGDVDLWFRLRSSVNKWTEAGQESLGTDRTELNTEMWCMWGVQDMRTLDEDTGALTFDLAQTMGVELDGNFAKWDIWPSDLYPETEPQVYRPDSASLALSVFSALIMLVIAL